MPRQPEPFSLLKRKKSPYFNFKLSGWDTYVSAQSFFRANRDKFSEELDCKKKTDAMRVIQVALAIQQSGNTLGTAPRTIKLKDLLKNAYTNSCPHVLRLREEGRSITDRYIKDCRYFIDNYLLDDQIVDIPFPKLKRADFLSFRSRMLEKTGPRTVNKMLSILHTVILEAIYREEIDKDPMVGISKVKTEDKKVGIFTLEELKCLFPEDGYGPWKDHIDYTVFLTASATGMRRGEILALRWKNVFLDKKYIQVNEAFKDNNFEEIGKPKWERSRITPIPEKLSKRLSEVYEKSKHTSPDNFVFCYRDGSPLGGTWWSKHFRDAMIKVKIDKESRRLKPHSFRHTLNTILRGSDYDSSKIRATLGWTTEKIQDGYTHFNIDHLMQQAETFESIFKIKKEKNNGSNQE